MSEENAKPEAKAQPKITLKERGDGIAQRLNDVGQAGIAAAFNGYRSEVEKAIAHAVKHGEHIDLIDDGADVGTPPAGLDVAGGDEEVKQNAPPTKPAKPEAKKSTKSAGKKSGGK